jgi:hypothetical protein
MKVRIKWIYGDEIKNWCREIGDVYATDTVGNHPVALVLIKRASDGAVTIAYVNYTDVKDMCKYSKLIQELLYDYQKIVHVRHAVPVAPIRSV